MSSQSAEAQELLKEAELILREAVSKHSLEASPKLHMFYLLIATIRVYSASSNEHPGLRGLGLEEALSLAEKIVATPPKNDRDIPIHSYRSVGKAFELPKKAV